MFGENVLKTWTNASAKKSAERNEERRLENVHFLPAFCEIERKIGNGNQEILGKIHRHAVAKILAGEILKQEPNQEYKNAAAPIIQDMNNERNHDQTQPEHDQILVGARDNPGRQFPNDGQDYQAHDRSLDLPIAAKRTCGRELHSISIPG